MNLSCLKERCITFLNPYIWEEQGIRPGVDACFCPFTARPKTSLFSEMLFGQASETFKGILLWFFSFCKKKNINPPKYTACKHLQLNYTRNLEILNCSFCTSMRSSVVDENILHSEFALPWSPGLYSSHDCNSQRYLWLLLPICSRWAFVLPKLLIW